MEAEEQPSFRVGRSILNHVFSLHQIVKKETVRSQLLHVDFIDKEKVYESVPLSNLWTALTSTSIKPIIIKAIKICTFNIEN